MPGSSAPVTGVPGVSALALVSPVLDFGRFHARRGLFEHLARLPAYAATARDATRREDVADVEAYARGDYLADLMRGVLVGLGLAALMWLWIDPSRAMWIAVSVLIVTCPCALSLALPVALTVATGEMARRGVVPTRGHAIGSMASVRYSCFSVSSALISEIRSSALEVCSVTPPPALSALT